MTESNHVSKLSFELSEFGHLFTFSFASILNALVIRRLSSLYLVFCQEPSKTNPFPLAGVTDVVEPRQNAEM